MASVVQFIHPGIEHVPDTNTSGMTSWNRGPHRRKFMVSNSRYVDNEDAVKSGKILFWGEWEPTSTVRKLRIPDSSQLYPKWLHTPQLPANLPSPQVTKDGEYSGGGCGGATYQNTDPFVFGDSFKYFVCKQYRPSTLNPTSLARLDKGSVILFGSSHGKSENAFFQIDTVFVIADYLEYDTNNADALVDDRVSSIYRKIVYKMAFPEPTPYSMRLRLYFGASYTNQIGGTYSFAPAKPYAGESTGFPRIRVKNKSYINANLTQGYKITDSLSSSQCTDVWKEIRDISRESGCVEAWRIT